MTTWTNYAVINQNKKQISFAIETGMRRSEILGLEWHQVDFNRQTALLPITKNGSTREVPLRAGVSDLRFHDLRHEAISRFFEMGLNMPEVAILSGHQVLRMLFRYMHLKAADLLPKINQRVP